MGMSPVDLRKYSRGKYDETQLKIAKTWSSPINE